MNVPIVRNHRGTGRQRRYAGISILQQVWDFVKSLVDLSRELRRVWLGSQVRSLALSAEKLGTVGKSFCGRSVEFSGSYGFNGRVLSLNKWERVYTCF